MKDHTDLLNFIAATIGAKTYLEIGVCNLDHNFNKINIADKVGVDPDPNAKSMYQCTSDFYFDTANKLSKEDGGGKKFDLIFIDGLHEAPQVRKDVINAWACLNPGGVIVMHDCNPPTEATTCVPRGSQREWCGDTYKTACQIQLGWKFTVDFDYGCMVLRKSIVNNGEELLKISNQEVTWEFFKSSRIDFLNLKSVESAKQHIALFAPVKH